MSGGTGRGEGVRLLVVSRDAKLEDLVLRAGRSVAGSGPVEVERRMPDAVDSLHGRQAEWDLILVDCRGEDAGFVGCVHQACELTPLVFLAAAGVERPLDVQPLLTEWVSEEDLSPALLDRLIRYMGRLHNSELRRRDARRAVRMKRSEFQSVIERNADAIVIVDLGRRVRFANPAAGRLFGRAPEGLVGMLFEFPVSDGQTTEVEVAGPGHRGPA